MDGKVFAGARIKRFRRERVISQADMARDLGISASYLNLIEHNQRPLSAALLLRLASSYELDLAQFDTAAQEQLIADLEHIFTDPLLEPSALGHQDRKQLAMDQPEWAEAFVKLHDAYRRGQESLSAMATQPGGGGRALGQIFEEPLEEVRDFFAANQNYFHALDTWAEVTANQWDLRPGNRRSRLVQAMADEHGYRVVERPARSLVPAQSLWDPHNRRLAVGLGISGAAKAFRIAQVYCRLSVRAQIEAVIAADPGLNGARAQQIALEGLVNYAAGALVMPYGDFRAVAEAQAMEVDAIADQLGLSFEQVAHRLSTMRRPGASGPPFFFIKLDSAGNVLKRFGNGGFGFPRHGNLCPAWSVFRIQRTSGETHASMVKLPNGQRYLSIAQHQSGPGRNTTVIIGCEARFVRQTAYATLVRLEREDLDEPIGQTCRLCSREACASRAVPMY